MMLLFTDPEGTRHEPGPWHPESPARLEAVMAAASDPALVDAIEVRAVNACGIDDLQRVHTPEMIARLDAVRGRTADLDADTSVSPSSVDVARRAAGAGLDAIAALDRHEADTAFCAVRPPGHHATRDRSMGFCLLNNIAVCAAALVARGERVVIADLDAHHGNGTQDVFYDDPSVMFVSWHQSPLYPGTGAADELGGPNALGSTVNIPLSAQSTGDLYLESLETVVGPIVEAFEPTWLLISAGFDAHRDDPLTEMGLTSGDYNRLVRELTGVVPSGRTIAFLEGGYDLAALERSARAAMEGLLGVVSYPEAMSSHGGDTTAISRVRRAREVIDQ